MLPELEAARLAASSRSGASTLAVRLDGRVLANVNTRMDLIAAAVADWALERQDIRARSS